MQREHRWTAKQCKEIRTMPVSTMSLSVSTKGASLPIAWRLYLPRVGGRPSAPKTGWDSRGSPVCYEANPCPATNPSNHRTGRAQAPVLADAGYGTDTQFREAIRTLGLPYVVGIMSSVSVW